MSKEIIPFEFDSEQVRVLEIDGEPWFVASDVARVLGYSNPQKAARDHCKGVNESFIPSNGGQQKATVIPERDVYRLIMRSKLPAAERFEEWVTGEVLPSIRKTGQYSPKAAMELTGAQLMARALIEADQVMKQLTAQIEADRPKVEFAEAVQGNPDWIDLGGAARTLDMAVDRFGLFL